MSPKVQFTHSANIYASINVQKVPGVSVWLCRECIVFGALSEWWDKGTQRSMKVNGKKTLTFCVHHHVTQSH